MPLPFPPCYNPDTGKYTILLNASALSHSACFLRLVLTTVFGYKTKFNSVNISYGQAFHKFFELYYQNGKDFAAAFEVAGTGFLKSQLDEREAGNTDLDAAKLDYGHLSLVCAKYHNQHQDVLDSKFKMLRNPKDNSVLLEQKVAIPLLESPLVDIGLCATIDGLYTNISESMLLVGDIKTTSKYDKEKFFFPFAGSFQLALYIWMLKYHAEKFPEGFLAKYIKDGTQVGAFILGVFLSTAKGKEQAEFATSPRIYFYSREFEEEMLTQIKQVAAAMAHYVSLLHESILRGDEVYFRPKKSGLFNGGCGQHVGPACGFFGACIAPSDEAMWGHLDNKFVKSWYDPRNFGGGPKEKKEKEITV